jgi:hypothetical protein
MAGALDSVAVFKARCTDVGLLAHDTTNLGTAGLDTVAGFAFSCNYVPGAADDAAFVTMVTTVNQGVDPPTRMLSSMRRLFFECYSLAAAEVRSRAERCEDSPVRKLAGPERLNRYDVLQLRLQGLLLEDDLEPSNAIVDYISQMVEDNQIRYFSLEKRSVLMHRPVCIV